MTEKLQIVIATKNKGKIGEIIGAIQIAGIEFISPQQAGSDYPEVEETGTTFEANAELKALAVAQHYGKYALADDSGLSVDFLDGAPGIHSARFSGADATDQKNNEKLLRDVAAAPEPVTARYVAAITLAGPNGVIATVRGICEGRITSEAKGEGGFGYDPYFVPKGYERTMAELAPTEKHTISHRGDGLRLITPHVRSLSQ